MKFDELARRAGESLRDQASQSVDHLDIAAAEGKRRRRTVALAFGGGVALLAAIVVGSLLAPTDDVAVTTLPEIPDSTAPPATSTTIPDDSPTTTLGEVVVEPADPGTILGSGWEELSYGPLTAGRYRMSTAMVGDQLFVFGGHLTYSQEYPPSSEFLQDGYMFDPEIGQWRSIGRPPPEMCHLGQTQAFPIFDGVLLIGSTSVLGADCARAALYRPDLDEWSILRGEFFDRASSRTATAFTGSLLVAPTIGLAYDFGLGATIEIPQVPVDADDNVSSPKTAHWDGSAVLSLGSDALYSWSPGDDEWTELPAPPIPDIARDSVLTADGLVAVNYQMAAARWDGEAWTRMPDLPLRFYECLPEAVSAGGTPMIRMCSGLAIWDEVGGFWVPVPLEDLTGATQGQLVGGDGALYSVGRRFRRFDIERDLDGSTATPRTLPIGIMQLDLPETRGFRLVGTYGAGQPEDGTIPEDESVGLLFEWLPGRSCEVRSTYGDPGLLPDPGLFIQRPGRPLLPVILLGGGDMAVEAGSSDVIRILCDSSEDATTFAGGLWSPWDDSSAESEGQLVVTPAAARPGEVVYLRGSGFAPDWDTLVLVDESSFSTVELDLGAIRNVSLGAEWQAAFSVDYNRETSIAPVHIPAGTYGFSVDGEVIPGATFTKIDRLVPRIEFGKVGFSNGELGTIELINNDVVGADISRWQLASEVGPTFEFIIPDGVLLAPGERFQIEVQYEGCPTNTGTGIVVCAGEGSDRPYESLTLRDYEFGRTLVDRRMLTDPCPWSADIDVECPSVRFLYRSGALPSVALYYQLPVDPVDFPVGPWRIADTPLTPSLTSPSEVISVGTFPMRQGGNSCAQIPQYALEDIRAHDAFVSLQRRGGTGYTGPPRPEEFTYEWLDANGGPAFIECLNRVDRDDLYYRFAPFVTEDGALYYVIVALGVEAERTVRGQQVLDILNSLEFLPG